jgi:hypothetical protein
LQQARPHLTDLGVRVVVVTFEGPQAAAAYVAETAVDWPVLVDDERSLYRAYGLQRAKLRHLIGPTTLIAYAREALRGTFPRRPTGDTMQQGGDVLIDPSGVVRFHDIGAGSGYRPTLERILSPLLEDRATPPPGRATPSDSV